MRRTLFLSTAALVFAGTTAMAQAKPNFAGKWTILPDSAPIQLQGISPGGGEMGGLGEAVVITQDEKVMTLTRNTPTMGEVKSVFNLDGTETYTAVNVGGQSIPLTLKSRWDGAKFIMSTFADVGQPIEIIMVMTIDAKGNLVTEHLIPAMGGGSSGGTLITHYKKGS